VSDVLRMGLVVGMCMSALYLITERESVCSNIEKGDAACGKRCSVAELVFIEKKTIY
jgi:hypothetical protein